MSILNANIRAFNSYTKEPKLQYVLLQLIEMHFALPRTVEMLHKTTQLFLLHLIYAHSRNTLYLWLADESRTERKRNYKILFFYVIVCSVSGWLIRINDMRGLCGVPCHLCFLVCPCLLSAFKTNSGSNGKSITDITCLPCMHFESH